LSPSECPRYTWQRFVETNYIYSDFERAYNPNDFFRPGQVFSIQCEGNLQAFSAGKAAGICDWNNLPLDKNDRLEQILKLPLDEMSRYAIVKGDNEVMCSLCPDNGISFSKQIWVEEHLAEEHSHIYRELLHTRKNQPSKWISLDDIDMTKPFTQSLCPPSTGTDAWAGSILLRRFVVIREGTTSCLCLGIHT
jgi:hypothetical protein